MWISVLLIIILIYLWFKNQFRYFQNLGFPYVEPIIPFGSSIKIGRKEHFGEFLKREYDNFKDKGPAFGVYIFTFKTLIPTDLDLVSKILVENFESFYERGIDLDYNVDPLSENVALLSGQRWKELRKQMSSIFSSGNLKSMLPILASKADKMIDFLNKNGNFEEVNLSTVFYSFTTESIISLMFSVETKCFGTADNDIMKFVKQFFVPSVMHKIKSFFLVAYPKIASILKLSLNSREANEFFFKFVADVMENRKRNNIQQNDFLQHFVNQMNKNELSFNDIVANCFVLILAGLETTENAILFCLYELALNLDIQDRLRSEIEEILKIYDGDVTYGAIMEMKYLDMVVKETLRKHPNNDNHVRRCTKDFKIPNTKLIIPAGTNINISAYAIHNDERFYENPDKFDPERFNEENIKKIHPFAYLPFTKGPRTCIGMRLGTMQVKVALINFLRNFKVSPCKKTLIPMKFCPNAQELIPLGGMWLKLERINTEN